MVRYRDRCSQSHDAWAETSNGAIRGSPVQQVYAACGGIVQDLPLVCSDARREFIDGDGVWLGDLGFGRGQSQRTSVELSTHSDLRGGDVRLGDNGGGACIGGDQGHEKVDPNHIDNVRCHLCQSNLEASLLGRLPCGVAMNEQQSVPREGLLRKGCCVLDGSLIHIAARTGTS